MDASFGPNHLGANEALTPTTPIRSQTSPSIPNSVNETKGHNQSIKHILKPAAVYKNYDLVSTQYIKYDNERKPNECTIQNSITTRGESVSNATTPTSSITSTPRSKNPNMSVKNQCLNTKSYDSHSMQSHTDINRDTNSYSVRSVSSPQLTIKPLARSKVYRKASLKSMNLSNSTIDNVATNHCNSIDLTLDTRIINISNCSVTSTDAKVPFTCLSETTQGEDSDDAKNKWNTGEVHITCNPLSTPYPYSTPHHNIMSETVTEPLDDEPKSRSCGSFLPILSLIPQTVVSFQYLSPKLKFSWWRNKIS